MEMDDFEFKIPQEVIDRMQEGSFDENLLEDQAVDYMLDDDTLDIIESTDSVLREDYIYNMIDLIDDETPLDINDLE